MLEVEDERLAFAGWDLVVDLVMKTVLYLEILFLDLVFFLVFLVSYNNLYLFLKHWVMLQLSHMFTIIFIRKFLISRPCNDIKANQQEIPIIWNIPIFLTLTPPC